MKSNNILNLRTALQIQYRYSSRNQAHQSWNFWYIIEVQTTLEKSVLFFSPKRSCSPKTYYLIAFLMKKVDFSLKTLVKISF